MAFKTVILSMVSALVLAVSAGWAVQAEVYIKKDGDTPKPEGYKPKVFIPYNTQTPKSQTYSLSADKKKVANDLKFLNKQVEAYQDWAEKAGPPSSVEEMVAFAQAETVVSQQVMAERRKQLLKHLEKNLKNPPLIQVNVPKLDRDFSGKDAQQELQQLFQNYQSKLKSFDFGV